MSSLKKEAAHHAAQIGASVGECLLSIHEVCRRTGLARSTIYAYIAQGLVAAPVQVGPGRVAWRSSDIAAFIESRPTVAHHELPNS